MNFGIYQNTKLLPKCHTGVAYRRTGGSGVKVPLVPFPVVGAKVPVSEVGGVLDGEVSVYARLCVRLGHNHQQTCLIGIFISGALHAEIDAHPIRAGFVYLVKPLGNVVLGVPDSFCIRFADGIAEERMFFRDEAIDPLLSDLFSYEEWGERAGLVRL
jgi:hypothetical protein